MTTRPIYGIENLRKDLEIWRCIAISRKSRRGRKDVGFEKCFPNSSKTQGGGGETVIPEVKKGPQLLGLRNPGNQVGAGYRSLSCPQSPLLTTGKTGRASGVSKGPLIPSLGPQPGTLTIPQLLGSPCTVPPAPAAGTSHSGTDVAAGEPTPFMPS